MAVYKLGAVEARFAELIWENEPLPSNRLTKLAEQELGWKKSTTYTILKRLCERGLFQNEGGRSRPRLAGGVPGRAERAVRGGAFGGSLPAFVAAFGSRRRLTDSELDELERLVESMRG